MAPYFYLASPYNHEDPAVMEARYRANVAALADLLHRGHRTFAPIVHHHPVIQTRDLGRGWEFWREQDMAFLRRAARVIVLTLPGWRESVGVTAEIQEAHRLGIPVEYVEAELPVVTPPLWEVDPEKTADHWLQLRSVLRLGADTEPAWEGHAKWDGCCVISDGSEESMHICDLDEFIAYLVEMRQQARAHFGKEWPKQ
jgi:hypothetical protein